MRKHQMTTAQQDAWINARWEHHRNMMDAPAPKTQRTDCSTGHGGDWDRWTWKGETLLAERGHCALCGQMFRGILSPWQEAAHADWQNHPYMIAAKREWRIKAQTRRIKSGQVGRKATIFQTRPLCDR